jgi:hypothetical protein
LRDHPAIHETAEHAPTAISAAFGTSRPRHTLGHMSSDKAHPVPTISRVSDDGTLIEALFNSTKSTTSLAVRRPDGTIKVVEQINLVTGEQLAPYSPHNNLISTGCVLLPSEVGEFGDKGDLVDEIRRYLRRYVDLSPAFEEITSYYVLLTWVHDAFNELGYLRLRGDYGSGKTRGLLTIGSICYKPFFASGASTVSPIFHILDAFQGTLVLDEADFRFSDATAELTKVLNNGNVKGMPVLRTMTNRHRELNPQAFRVFGPKIIAMRESFSDRALESRFITEETGGRSLRPDIPIHLPDSMKVEALALRNKLLAWRFHVRHEVGPDPSRLVPGLTPRLNQTALALLSLIDDEAVRARVTQHLFTEDHRMRTDRADTHDGPLYTALYEAFSVTTASYVSVADVAQRFNAANSENFYLPVTNKWVGSMLRNRLRIATMKSRGIYVVPQSERPKIETLAARFGMSKTMET